MRTHVLILASLLCCAVPARAGLFKLSPDSVTIQVGETVPLRPYYVPGFMWPPFEYNVLYHFVSDDPFVAQVSGTFMISAGPGQFVYVRGVAPGYTSVRFAEGSYVSGPEAQVLVQCPARKTAFAREPIAVPVGATALLAVDTPVFNPTVHWFESDVSDKRTPLAGTDLTYVYRASAVGPHRVWASVSDACGEVTVQFPVEVTGGRGRGSRH